MVAHAEERFSSLPIRSRISAEEILQVVGRRRVGGEAAVPRQSAAARPRPARRAAWYFALATGISSARISISSVGGRLPAVEDVEGLLEVEEPERQTQVLGADDVGAAAEGGAVFVVDVEQQDPQLGPHLDRSC